MSESQKFESAVSSPALNGNKVRRKLSVEKKFQIYLEAQRSDQLVGDVLRREGLYATDLTRIQDQVREGALERLSARPGKKPRTVPLESYEALKRELVEKERALAEHAVELTMLRKKRIGVCGNEASFSTVKRDPEYPGRFLDLEDGYGYFNPYLSWYNQEHYHSGIDYVTPDQAHRGLRDQIVAQRQEQRLAQVWRRREVNLKRIEVLL